MPPSLVVCDMSPEKVRHRFEGLKPVISLKEAALEQIVSELRSRSDLAFALIVLITKSGPNSGIFASQECDGIDVVRLLIAGAQDIMECLVEDQEGTKAKGQRGSETIAWRESATLPSLSGQVPERPLHKKLRHNYVKATEKAQEAAARR